MDKIKISVSGNIAVVAEKPKRITSGTTGLPVEFTFDSEWDELRKVAVFDSCCVRKDMIIKDGATVVPIENLATHGACLCIGVYGVNEDGSVAIPTIWANAGMIYPGAVPEGELGSDIGTAKEQYDAAVLASERSENAANRSEAAASEAENNAGLANDAAFRADAAMVSAVSASESAHQSEQNVGASVEYIEIQKYNINQSVAEAKNAQHYAEEAADRAEAATVSPTITVGEIEGGHQVTITDIDGEKSFDVMDGVDGKPGEKGDPGAKGDRGEKGETGNSGVYLGSGEMPDDCNVQIDPNGEPLDAEQFASKAYVDDAVKGKAYELIEEITLEKTAALDLTAEPPKRGGKPYAFDAILITGKTEVGTTSGDIRISVENSNTLYGKAYISAVTSGQRYFTAEIYKQHGRWAVIWAEGTNQSGIAANMDNYGRVTQLLIRENWGNYIKRINTAGVLGAGSVVKIYAVRHEGV